jgi:hypothetical protein
MKSGDQAAQRPAFVTTTGERIDTMPGWDADRGALVLSEARDLGRVGLRPPRGTAPAQRAPGALARLIGLVRRRK